MIFMLKMDPTENGSKLQGCPTTLQFAISRSDVVFLLTVINCGVRQPESINCLILIESS
jgi:hypothetical protein